jgi:hypothetical protein
VHSFKASSTLLEVIAAQLLQFQSFQFNIPSGFTRPSTSWSRWQLDGCWGCISSDGLKVWTPRSKYRLPGGSRSPHTEIHMKSQSEQQQSPTGFVKGTCNGHIKYNFLICDPPLLLLISLSSSSSHLLFSFLLPLTPPLLHVPYPTTCLHQGYSNTWLFLQQRSIQQLRGASKQYESHSFWILDNRSEMRLLSSSVAGGLI